MGTISTTAVAELVKQRTVLIAQADRSDAKAASAAIKADELYMDAADYAAEALDIREEVKNYNIAINALGGEPKLKLSERVKKASARKA